MDYPWPTLSLKVQRHFVKSHRPFFLWRHPVHNQWDKISYFQSSMWRSLAIGAWAHPPKNASALWGSVGSRWLTISAWQVSYVQYLLACQKSQRCTPYNIVKSGLPWKRVFRRRHLGRRVTGVTCLRWPTVGTKSLNQRIHCELVDALL